MSLNCANDYVFHPRGNCFSFSSYSFSKLLILFTVPIIFHLSLIKYPYLFRVIIINRFRHFILMMVVIMIIPVILNDDYFQKVVILITTQLSLVEFIVKDLNSLPAVTQFNSTGMWNNSSKDNHLISVLYSWLSYPMWVSVWRCDHQGIIIQRLPVQWLVQNQKAWSGEWKHRESC